MSTIQAKEKEIRYLKRQNLKQEQRMIGNWYRDIIRSYGVDVIYQKLDTSVVENFNGIVDRNFALQRAYGQIYDPDYTCSADMISYLEVDQDIFQLQKYGMNPITDVNFYFDSIDFACALATKLGQFEEYKIDETEIVCEVPECNNTIISAIDPTTHEFVTSSYLSDDIFPYKLGLGHSEEYHCGILSGKLSVEIDGYDLGQEKTVVCDPYEHGDFMVEFPTDEYLYKGMKRWIANDDYLQSMIQLTFKVDKIVVGKNPDGTDITKCILHGKLHGGILFYNINKIGKFIDRIHPEVGDRIIIDFPDEANREQYEITDCFDKQLTQDGISPLLGTYIWKCKARRYIHSNDDVEMTEKDRQMKEKKKFQRAIDNEVMSHISEYPDDEDAAYGGYAPVEEYHEEHHVDPHRHAKLEYLRNGELLDIHIFGCGCKLATDGYDLLFVNAKDEAIALTLSEKPFFAKDVAFDTDLRFLKASDSLLVFTNIAGETFKLVEDAVANQGETQLCLNSLFDTTINPGETNKENNNFYVFKSSKTLLWATKEHLYCKLSSNGQLCRLV